ncbi:MAG: hypothetical protein ACI9KK_001726 [Ascidiaceihabitans sp.]|jgi:hypothetical protein
MNGIELFLPGLSWMEKNLPGTLTHDLGALLHGAGWASDENWNSIGQFYSFIRCMIASDLVYEDDFTTGAAAQQIQSSNYSPNNVDTIYSNEKFNKKAPAPNPDAPSGGCPSGCNAAQVAVYTNEPDSHSGSQAGNWEKDEELIRSLQRRGLWRHY